VKPPLQVKSKAIFGKDLSAALVDERENGALSGEMKV
jgi:hypothetical protein